MYITIEKFTCVPPEIPCTPAMHSTCGMRNANRVSHCLRFQKTYQEGFIPWLGDKISGGFCIWLGDYLILSISPIMKGNFYVPGCAGQWKCLEMEKSEVENWEFSKIGLLDSQFLLHKININICISILRLGQSLAPREWMSKARLSLSLHFLGDEQQQQNPTPTYRCSSEHRLRDIYGQIQNALLDQNIHTSMLIEEDIIPQSNFHSNWDIITVWNTEETMIC